MYSGADFSLLYAILVGVIYLLGFICNLLANRARKLSARSMKVHCAINTIRTKELTLLLKAGMNKHVTDNSADH